MKFINILEDIGLSIFLPIGIFIVLVIIIILKNNSTR